MTQWTLNIWNPTLTHAMEFLNNMLNETTPGISRPVVHPSSIQVLSNRRIEKKLTGPVSQAGIDVVSSSSSGWYPLWQCP